VVLMSGVTMGTVITILLLPALYSLWFRIPLRARS
jgi:multidrug efflux pump subunit AcrB